MSVYASRQTRNEEEEEEEKKVTNWQSVLFAFLTTATNSL